MGEDDKLSEVGAEPQDGENPESLVLNSPLEGDVELLGLLLGALGSSSLASHESIETERLLAHILGLHNGELRSDTDADDEDDCEDPHHRLPGLASDEVHGHDRAKAHSSAGGSGGQAHRDTELIDEPLTNHRGNGGPESTGADTSDDAVEEPVLPRLSGIAAKEQAGGHDAAVEQVGLAGTELIDISTGQECKDSVEDHEEGRAQRNNTRRPTSTCAHALDESCKGSANHHVAKHNDDGGDGNRPTGEFQIGIPGVRIRFHLYYS